MKTDAEFILYQAVFVRQEAKMPGLFAPHPNKTVDTIGNIVCGVTALAQAIYLISHGVAPEPAMVIGPVVMAGVARQLTFGIADGTTYLLQKAGIMQKPAEKTATTEATPTLSPTLQMAPKPEPQSTAFVGPTMPYYVAEQRLKASKAAEKAERRAAYEEKIAPRLERKAERTKEFDQRRFRNLAKRGLATAQYN